MLNYILLLMLLFLLILAINLDALPKQIVQAVDTSTLPLPTVSDPNLKVELVTKGFANYPTSLAFLNESSFFVLEKDSGQVHLVTKGTGSLVLQVPVNASGERGMLGIAVLDHDKEKKDVFLYFTEADPLRNRVYKYQWDGQSLVNPTLVLDLPADPGPLHNGGKIVVGPDGYLYVVIGNLMRSGGQLQNFRGSPPDDSGVILRVSTENGSAAPGNPFINSEDPLLGRYYAYGIRNSFGMDFDPRTWNLWDTENGESNFDELNLVKPGFNSGWGKIMGPRPSSFSEDQLVEYVGSQYTDPVFSWRDSIGLTELEFYTSSALGDKYLDNLFVGDVNKGNLYFFVVNETRNGIKWNTAQKILGLSDHIADNENELSLITFGAGFNSISDIETGPDGCLYVLSLYDGAVYRILPRLFESC